MTEKQTRLQQFLLCNTAQMCLAAVVAMSMPLDFSPAQKEELADLDIWQKVMSKTLFASGAGVLPVARKTVKSYSEYLLRGVPNKTEVPQEEALSYWLHALFAAELLLTDCVYGCSMFASGIVWQKAKNTIKAMAKRYAQPDESLPEEAQAWQTYIHFSKAIKSEVANRKRGK